MELLVHKYAPELAVWGHRVRLTCKTGWKLHIYQLRGHFLHMEADKRDDYVGLEKKRLVLGQEFSAHCCIIVGEASF